ncbi:unnamed protein product [Rotaria magnacalcarata]|uniref:Uncharacterized protein n=1 Tax=Rotaria magnacalcarata TaxID=392030 RepID=A0A814DXW7_9BILA|nr:unnamed protein product [Rotaria magnacalcarata]CAF1666302.1 unnamed protein product [Rotaria magnacalcarata]CAF2144609.1 unnamed protein product [Rotaria magnacalcarata]CAF2206530.1 unnamed protein product [Rotaria magnacalcarata]CAF3768988.1 unnamed protein product [Rotaria magnacalcarata]
MTDRRFTIQTDPRGSNALKTTAPSNVARDDIQAQLTNNGPSSGNAGGTGERRPSQAFFRRLSMSLGSNRKASMFPTSSQPRPNTYRMEPDNEYRFRPYKLQAKVLEVLAEQMKDQVYDPTTVNELVKEISRSVNQLVKNFQLSRYKIVIQAMIVQKYDQILRAGSRCLWDPKTDNMLSVHYETKDMVAVVTVYAVYFE